MKVLTLSRNKMELASTQLRRPMIVIGRSPTCDVVLRAPGIKPVHFIVEWIGSGVFDPKKGSWSIVDVSTDADAGEGLVLGQDTLVLGDLSFRCQDSILDSQEVIGGQIVQSLTKQQANAGEMLEFVQVRSDSGAIELIQHYPLVTKHKVEEPSKEFKEIKIEHPKLKSDSLVNVLLEDMPGVKFMLSGRKIEPKGSLPLRSTDFLQMKWEGRDFYLRFVEEVNCAPIKRDFWGDPLLFKLTLAVSALLLLLTSLIFFRTKDAEPEPELPRVARVEVPAKPPAPTPAPPSESPPVNPIAEKATASVKVKNPEAIVKNKTVEAPAKAAAAKQNAAPNQPPKEGLNIAAPTTNVNQVGLLGALNKNLKKGAGIQADKILNEGVIKQTVSANDQSKIVLRNPPAGVLGSGDGGSPSGKGNQSLSAASTTLSGVNKADSKSQGLIARKSGESGFKLGSASTGSGAGVGGESGSSIGGIDATDFSVDGGGLDRESVRKVILSYRNQIRNCYERAMISSPNLNGRLVYQWQIQPQGEVVLAVAVKDSVQSPNLKACVLDVIEKMRFPKAANGRKTTVNYPFVFQGKK